MVNNPARAEAEEVLELMALHKYFLNADFLRDIFMCRISEQGETQVSEANKLDNQTALSLWYATLYVVIEGWQHTGRSDPLLDTCLADPLADDLRIFRNQIFHYQKSYANLKLLQFLGDDDATALQVVNWVRQTHAALGAAIEGAVEGLIRPETE